MRRALLVVLPLLCGCEYVRLLRPKALKQLSPDTVRLVNELPELDQPNKEIIARLFPQGGLVHADEHDDHTMHAEIRVPAHQFVWQPAIVVMPHAGELQLTFHNQDDSTHMAFLPSDGARQVLELPMHTAGEARIVLGQPGLYWFGCPVANHAGRGMLGLVIVKGETTPQEARLERPPQHRPGD
ncbi:MAG: MSMEG_3727 family PQQ-associated protein [Myxococcales bacterium]